MFKLKFNKRKQLHKFSQPSRAGGWRGVEGERSDQQDRLESPDTQSWYRGRRLGATHAVGLGAEDEDEEEEGPARQRHEDTFNI